MNLVEQLAKASAASPPKRVLGIDRGTTNSTVAQVQLPLDPAGSPELLSIKAKTGVPIRLHLRVEAGDGKDRPPQTVADQINETLAKFKKDLKVT